MYFGGFEIADKVFDLFSNLSDKLDVLVSDNFSIFNESLGFVVDLVDYLRNIINWLASYLGISSSVYLVCYGLIISGFGMIAGSFIIKTVVKWWSALVP